MADTKRSSTDLLTNLFQNGQADGAITAADMRDLITSLLLPHGAAVMDDNAVETSISGIEVFENIAGVFVEADSLKEITVNPAGGVLTYTGVPDRHFHIVSNLSLVTASNNKIICAQWFKNGTTALLVPIRHKVGTGTDIVSLPIHADATLSTNDTLELKVTNATDTTNLTIKSVYTFVTGMFV